MKKITKAFFTIASVLALFSFVSCADAIVDDGTNIKKYTSSGPSLYLVAEGYEQGPWGCWEATPDGDTAICTKGSEGGLRIETTKRGCGSTYAGVNLAAGTEVGANADLDGSMFTKVVFEFRGNIDASLISFYGLNADKTKKCGDCTGQDAQGNDVFKTLDKYDTEYNAETWTQITIDLPNSTSTMSSALTLSIANDPNWDEGKWVEIRNIDWQNDSGKSVVPVYVK